MNDTLSKMDENDKNKLIKATNKLLAKQFIHKFSNENDFIIIRNNGKYVEELMLQLGYHYISDNDICGILPNIEILDIRRKGDKYTKVMLFLAFLYEDGCSKQNFDENYIIETTSDELWETMKNQGIEDFVGKNQNQLNSILESISNNNIIILIDKDDKYENKEVKIIKITKAIKEIVNKDLLDIFCKKHLIKCNK